MVPVDHWAIIYADGSRFTSSQGTWAEAPAFGVFAVVYYRIDGTRLIQMEQVDDSRYEWSEFVPKPDGWATIEGEEAAGSIVKFGLWVSNDEYYKLFDAVYGEVLP